MIYLREIYLREMLIKYEKKHHTKEIRESEYIASYECKDLKKFERIYPYKKISSEKWGFFSHIADIVEGYIPENEIEDRKKCFKHAIREIGHQTILYDTSVHEQNKNAPLIQIDLSKNIKDIETYIRKIKNDYEEKNLVVDPVKLIYRDFEPYSKKEIHKDIYNLKKGSSKELYEVLGSLLYIYDYNFLGLKNIQIDNFNIKTLNKYTKIINNYILNNKNLKYLLSS